MGANIPCSGCISHGFSWQGMCFCISFYDDLMLPIGRKEAKTWTLSYLMQHGSVGELTIGRLLGVFLALLSCRCPGQVNQTPLVGRVAGARAFSLTRSYQLSSISTMSVFVTQKSFISWGQGSTECLGIMWGIMKASGGTTCWMQKVTVHGLVASSALTKCEDGDKSCPVLFSVWASISPNVFGRNYIDFDYASTLQMLFGPATSPPWGLLLVSVGRAMHMESQMWC